MTVTGLYPGHMKNHRETRLRIGAPMLLAACSLTSACTVPDADSEQPSADQESETTQATTPMRHIPVRIVEVSGCAVGVDPGCTALASAKEIIEVFDRVNDVYAVAGLEFWVKSVDQVESTTFMAFGGDDDLPFSTVGPELRKIFPTMPAAAFYPTTVKSRAAWINSGSTLWGDPDEVLLVLHSVGGKSVGQFPEKGRFVRVGRASFHNDPDGDDTTVETGFGGLTAHELGHFFGLGHVSGGNRSDGINPSTGAAWSDADLWDLYRCAGSTYGFTSKSDALACSDRRIIEADNGGATDRFTPTLTVGTTTFDAADHHFPGLLFDLGGTHNPPDHNRWGVNVMTYYSNYVTAAGEKLDGRVPGRISPSQARLVGFYADYDQPYSSEARADHIAGLYQNTGLVANNDRGLRPSLGQTTDDMLWLSNGNLTFANRTTPISGTDYAPVAADLDGNGYTDLVWYRPSTGLANLWLATGTGGFTYVNNASLGSGAKLIPGDFDGDGRVELLVDRGGNGVSAFREWNGTSFTNQAVSTSGWTAVAGNFDGAFGDDILWYSPTGGNVWAWWSTGGANMTSSVIGSIALGYRPFAGDFDGDGRDDVLMYIVGSSAPDRVWYGQASRTFDSRSVSIAGDYQPIVGDFDGDGRDDIIWENPGSSTEALWTGSANRSAPFVTGERVMLHGSFRGLPGRFDNDAVTDVFWYKQ